MRLTICATLSHYNPSRARFMAPREFKVAAWNVRTLLTSATYTRPERTALIAGELGRYNSDIAALKETRLCGKGKLTEDGGKYTFYLERSKRKRAKGSWFCHYHQKQPCRSVAETSIGNKRSYNDTSAPTRKQKESNLHRYLRINDAHLKGEYRKKSNEELNEVLTTTSKSDKLLILGDFNARVGTNYVIWNGVLEKDGIRQQNDNGLRLLQLCSINELTITNTLFRLPNRQKTSWMHPRSKHWHLIDYVLTRKKDQKDVRVTKAMCGANCWTSSRSC